MAVPSLSKTRPIHSLFRSLYHPKPFLFFSSLTQEQPTSRPLANLVTEISRVLSDHRNPHHDLDRSLTTFSSHISTQLVEQVLKRCKNLGFSAHRFFLWADKIPGFQHSDKSYHILVDILGSSKQFAILWDFLIEIRDGKQFEINPEIFWVVFRAYCRANLPGDAIRAFDRMVEFGIRPSIHDVDQLLFVLCKRKHVKQAQGFFDRVKHEFEPSAKSYSILVRGWGDIGEACQARKVFDEMVQRGCSIDVLAYNCLFEALCKSGNVDEAYKMFGAMGSSRIELDACSYSVFIRAYCEANDIHAAFRVLDRMRRYNLVPNLFTYNCIIRKLCNNDKVDEAYQLLTEMIERGISPDEWSYNAILAYHCEHSEVNRALNLISRMEKNECFPDRHTYNMALKLLIRIGRFDRATELWESMANRGFYPSVSTYAVMIHGLCKKRGKLEEACRYFEIMIDEGIPPYSSTVELLRNRLLGLGFLDNIEILANKMARSSSCSIQELANAMRGKTAYRRTRSEETELESE
ncbi:PREDICTED: pentatricopeptide repeat-containing protein At1g52640, mitochondrial [Theobroma cacao]|uniref:Pentatricopeptide repeat-containing protein At1g52640, mitochondrial n=1 Tax=Theobroma cacao TaxID=3641 RepID=A0AB32UYW2_THECC|nr:PREDICTED: pentatricopeptide repeat-containing protein At1g52640, mitochondrial [Theobroma cacao]